MSSSDHASEKLVLVFLYQARCTHEGRDAEMQRETSAKDGERRRRRGEKERRRWDEEGQTEVSDISGLNPKLLYQAEIERGWMGFQSGQVVPFILITATFPFREHPRMFLNFTANPSR